MYKVKVKIWNGNKVLGIHDIAMIHKCDPDVLRTKVYRVMKKMEQNVDYYKLSCTEARSLKTPGTRKDGKTHNFSRGMIALTATGYHMVLGDNPVVNKVVDDYFFSDVMDGEVKITFDKELQKNNREISKLYAKRFVKIVEETVENKSEIVEPEIPEEMEVVDETEKEMGKEENVEITEECFAEEVEKKTEPVSETVNETGLNKSVVELITATLAVESERNESFRKTTLEMIQNFQNTTLEMLRMEQKKYDSVMELMGNAFNLMETIVNASQRPRYNNYYDRKTSSEKPSIATQQPFLKPYGEWKKEINDLASEIANTNGSKYSSRSEVLHEAYDVLNKKYGVCWAQEEREFYTTYGRKNCSTMELQYFIEEKNHANVNLLSAVLKDIQKEVAA